MKIDEIKTKIESKEYDFLRKKPLKDSIILLGLGGSYAYGTNVENSDIDIRGIANNSAEEILCGNGFDQVLDNQTDTTVYSLKKIISLLSNCNPNTIEILGLEDSHYLYMNDIGRALVKNADMFLSKRAVQSFGGYANAQLRRLENKSARLLAQSENEKHILNSIENASYSFKDRYFPLSENDYINLYVDKAVNKEYDSEIFMDAHVSHYPLRDYRDMWSEMNSILKSYSSIGKRNRQAVEHNKLGKHMMHLIRLYFMCFDILRDGKIVTYRKKDHETLMEIRNGKYLDENEQPTREFYDWVTDLENELEYLKDHTDLPDNPDYERINKFLTDANYEVVINGYKNAR